MGHRGVFHVHHEASGLRPVRGEGGVGSLGGRKADVDARVYAVLGQLGQADVLARGCPILPHFVGESLSIRGMDGGLGVGPSQHIGSNCDGSG